MVVRSINDDFDCWRVVNEGVGSQGCEVWMKNVFEWGGGVREAKMKNEKNEMRVLS